MSIGSILLLIAVVLGFSCALPLLVRMNNPRLLGLGWMGGALAAGGSGSVLLYAGDRVPELLSIVLADELVLLSFVLLHCAVLEITEERIRPILGLVLIAIQVLFGFLRVSNGIGLRGRITVAGLLIAVQSAQSGLLLLRRLRRGSRAPSYFCAGFLFVFAAMNIARSAAEAMNRLRSPEVFARVEALTFVLFFIFSQGILFGFFWMTTARLTARLDDLASTDPLTRLLNRRVFLRWCEREEARSREAGGTFSVLLLDLDHFKRINDSFGHAAGDVVICRLVETMQNSVRGIDLLGRWGGEEFVALLPGASGEAALLVAQRIRGNIEKTFIPVSRHGGSDATHSVRLTASVGVATWMGSEDTAELMLKRADAALYRAKEAGRNRVLLDASTSHGLLPMHPA